MVHSLSVGSQFKYHHLSEAFPDHFISLCLPLILFYFLCISYSTLIYFLFVCLLVCIMSAPSRTWAPWAQDPVYDEISHPGLLELTYSMHLLDITFYYLVPHSKVRTWVPLVSPYYKQRNRDWEKLRDLAKTTKLESARAWLRRTIWLESQRFMKEASCLSQLSFLGPSQLCKVTIPARIPLRLDKRQGEKAAMWAVGSGTMKRPGPRGRWGGASLHTCLLETLAGEGAPESCWQSMASLQQGPVGPGCQ